MHGQAYESSPVCIVRLGNSAVLKGHRGTAAPFFSCFRLVALLLSILFLCFLEAVETFSAFLVVFVFGKSLHFVA